MPSHRACSGCGAPAVWGSWCAGCAQERDVQPGGGFIPGEQPERVNVLVFPGPGVPPRADVDLGAAVERALGRG